MWEQAWEKKRGCRRVGMIAGVSVGAGCEEDPQAWACGHERWRGHRHGYCPGRESLARTYLQSRASSKNGVDWTDSMIAMKIF